MASCCCPQAFWSFLRARMIDDIDWTSFYSADWDGAKMKQMAALNLVLKYSSDRVVCVIFHCIRLDLEGAFFISKTWLAELTTREGCGIRKRGQGKRNIILTMRKYRGPLLFCRHLKTISNITSLHRSCGFYLPWLWVQNKKVYIYIYYASDTSNLNFCMVNKGEDFAPCIISECTSLALVHEITIDLACTKIQSLQNSLCALESWTFAIRCMRSKLQ